MTLANLSVLRFPWKLLRSNALASCVSLRGINFKSNFGQKTPEAVAQKSLTTTFETVSPLTKKDEWVPIMDVYGDKLNLLNTFDAKCTEIPKVLKFILQGENILIRKEQALAVNFYFQFVNDYIRIPLRKKQERVDGMNTRSFSPAKFGPMSDEFLIMKAEDELISKASVTNYQQLIKDVLDNIKEQQWVSAIVGCYLSKYLPTPRYPQQVFMKAAKNVVFQAGRWSKTEKDVLLSHITSHCGKWELNDLHKQLPQR